MRSGPRLLASLACALAAGALLAFAVPAPAPAAPKQEFEARVDSYPPAERAVLRDHLRRALSGLPPGARPFERAAAINSYAFQHVRIAASQGDGVHTLTTGGGRCGGMATAMNELLHLAGIRSRHAALLGIPFQGNHSLVQAYFKGGRSGLFDPTFGVFWYSPRYKRPVPLGRLLADPSRSSRTLFKSVDRKRKVASDPVRPIEGVADGYRLRHDYSEHATRPGEPSMDWRLAFRVRGGAGLANTGVPIHSRIRLRPGDAYGYEVWDGSTPTPWNRLALAKDRSGLTLPWAFELGDASLGFKVVHSYRLRHLVAGRRYRLTLFLSRAESLTLTAYRGSSGKQLLVERVPEWRTTHAGQVVPHVDIPFKARADSARLTLAARGHALLQAIRLR